MNTRREILTAAAALGGVAVLNRIARGESMGSATKATRLPPSSSQTAGGRTSVITPNGVTLPYKLMGGVKVMHLIAEEFEHEFVPGLKATCWGYNGRTPGPTIEAVAGDRLRIYVTNKLPGAPTTVHWHGIRVPNGMDGVNGLTQPAIAPGQTFRYEFVVPDAGTFMYHPHFDEMTQQALGMMGMFIVHPGPGDASEPPPDRDYAIMLSEWRIDPGARRPNPIEMTDFNVLTMNSKCYPATQPIVARAGERVRLRFGNLGAMEHHPIHLHGFQMTLTETDGGIVPPSARYAANTVLVPVGSTRAVEFIADNPGDWPMHCHMTHHAMNQMGHDVPNMVGVDTSAMNDAVKPVVPAYMAMGGAGMGEMASMRMRVPPNSIPMLGGKGQFGPIDMGGMFTLVKVREDIVNNNDPGDYQFPPGSIASQASDDELRRDGINT